MIKEDMLEIGMSVWKKESWSNLIAEYIIDNLTVEEIRIKNKKEIRLVVHLQSAAMLGNTAALSDDLFLSYEDAAAFYQEQSKKIIQEYTNQMTGETTEDTLKNMIRFAYHHNISHAEEYTDEDAKTAFRQMAESLNITLEES